MQFFFDKLADEQSFVKTVGIFGCGRVLNEIINARRRFFFVLFARDDVHKRFARFFGIKFAENHRVARVIRTRIFLRHRNGKYLVDSRKNPFRGTEIFGKPHGFALARVVSREFLGKNIGIATAERVNALLDVADHKQMIGRDEIQNSFLNAVYVLIFVAKRVFILTLNRFQRVRRRGKELVRQMFEVGKVGVGLLAFQFIVFLFI